MSSMFALHKPDSNNKLQSSIGGRSKVVKSILEVFHTSNRKTHDHEMYKLEFRESRLGQPTSDNLPTTPEELILLATTEMTQKTQLAYASAHQCYQKILSTSPNHSPAIKGLADLLCLATYSKKDYPTSQALYDQAITLNPYDFNIYYAVAISLCDESNPKKSLQNAAKYLQKFSDLDPENANFLTYRGCFEVYYLHRYEKGIKS